MRIFPLSSHTAESSVMPPHCRRANPLPAHRSSPPDSPRSIADNLWTASSLRNQATKSHRLTNQTPYKDEDDG
jgi:hypothetical protein